MVEGEEGVTLEVEVKEGDIPVSQDVEVTLTTTDQSANGVKFYIYVYMYE